ncbi:MAG: DUF3267 domain-containing protein [Anaerolineales bacterium]|nr:DUF3267 domain-containing protein [Anaerolineales bacterium]
MKATQTLPSQYTLLQEIDLSRDRRLSLALNLVAAALLFPAGWLFIRLVIALRPEIQQGAVLRIELSSLLGIVLAFIAVLVIHELVHGLFFWLITRQRPRFGLRAAYAFAAAPDWYLPRDPYLAVGLSPLVLITLLGVALIPILPAGGLLPLVFALTTNAAGAVGDVAIVVWLLCKPPDLLVQDRGDAVAIYHYGNP